MITINLSRKEAYGVAAGLTLIPLAFFSACLFGLQFLQQLQQDNSRFNPASQISVAPAPTTIKTAAIDNDAGLGDQRSDNIAAGTEQPPASETITAQPPLLSDQPIDSADAVEISLAANDSETSVSAPVELAMQPQQQQFFIQLASFAKQANAEAYIEQLQQDKQPAQLLFKAESATPYIVASGQFDSLDQARQAAKAYNRIHRSNSFGISYSAVDTRATLAQR